MTLSEPRGWQGWPLFLLSAIRYSLEFQKLGKRGPSWNREGGKVANIFRFVKSGLVLSFRNLVRGDPLGSERGVKVGHIISF